MNAEKKEEIKSKLAELFENFKTGRFLMSLDRISRILRFEASEPELFAVIQKANNNFSFEAEFSSAAEGGTFKLPAGNEKIAALVTGLLYKFDRKQIDFHAFISNFYRSLTANDEFLLFEAAVIAPYKAALFALVDDFEEPEEIAEEPVKLKPLEEAASGQILPILVKMTEEIAASKMPSARRKEHYYILEGLYYAISAGDERQIRAGFFGLKHAIITAKFLDPYMKNLENLLGLYFSF